MTDDEHNDQNASPPAGDETLRRCENCNAPMRDDQRYCLECGARRGAARLDFAAFWRRADGASGPSAATAPGASAAPTSTRHLPSRRLSAALACVVLGAGIAVGDLIGPGPASSLASGAAGLPVGVLGAIAAAQSTHNASKVPKSSSPQAPASEGSVEAEAATPEAEASDSATEAEASSEESTAPEEGATSNSEAGESHEGGSGEGAHKQKTSNKTEALVSDSVLQQIKYVWLIDLSGSSFKQARAKQASDPYLAKTLVSKGTVLSDYSLVASSPLANDVALLSGQGSNAATEEDCPTYEPVEPPTVESKGLTEGVGCIYPTAAKTLADQVTEAALTWKAYVQDMAPTAGATETSTTTSAATASEPTVTTTTSSTSSETASTISATSEPPGASATEASTQTCRHPALGGSEPNLTPAAGTDYLLYRNPFVYFDSLLESGACTNNDVDLTALKGDLAETEQTPNLSWIVPSACDDGGPSKCGASSGGLVDADRFLKEVVPAILASKAYKEHGLIVITFDSGPTGKSGASKPNAKVGALLISPFVKADNADAHTFTTYSLLMSIERLYGVPLLGHANDEGLEELGAGVYSTSAKSARAAATSRHGSVKKSG